MKPPKVINLKITDNDRRYGKPKNCFDCPVARALRRRFPKSFICVGKFSIEIGPAVYGSRQATKFITLFDNDRKKCKSTTLKLHRRRNANAI